MESDESDKNSETNLDSFNLNHYFEKLVEKINCKNAIESTKKIITDHFISKNEEVKKENEKLFQINRNAIIHNNNIAKFENSIKIKEYNNILWFPLIPKNLEFFPLSSMSILELFKISDGRDVT